MAFVDTRGHAELATNTTGSEQAVVDAISLGVPDGEPPTYWVELEENMDTLLNAAAVFSTRRSNLSIIFQKRRAE